MGATTRVLYWVSTAWKALRATFILFWLAALSLSPAPAPFARAASVITVTSTSGGKGGPGCTLRDALTAANTDSATGGCPAGNGADTVVLSNATYTLSQVDNQPVPESLDGLPIVTSAITIEGHQAIVERSSASAVPQFRVFAVATGSSLNLKNLTIRNGARLEVPGGGIRPNLSQPTGALDCGDPFSGGGILNCGVLTLTNVTISGNNASFGAGIYNGGTLSVSGSTITANLGEDDGGGIYNAGTLTLVGGLIDNNGATNIQGGEGGGIFNAGVSTLSNTTISGNTSTGHAGGIANAGVLTATDTTINGNAADGSGGGLFNEGALKLNSATIMSNTADANSNGLGDGGGIFLVTGALSQTNTVVTGNFDTPANSGTGNIYPNVAVDNATSLTVNAVIKPPDISLPNPFAICVTGPSYPLPNCQNFGSQFTYTVTWYDLKPGTYTVTEPDSGMFSDVTGVPATLAVPLGSARTITATHTLRFRLFLPLVARARS